jgi:hypothetical protein
VVACDDLGLVLVAAYVISAALEIVGIGLVILDVRGDRDRARALLDEPRPNYVPETQMPRFAINIEFDEDTIRRNPTGPAARSIYQRRARDAEQALRESQAIALGSATAEAELLRAIADMLTGAGLFRRLLGPGLVAIGILVGTAANIAAS